MTHAPTAVALIDHSGFAPVIGTAVSMLGMLMLVAGSAVHMMF